MTRRIFEYIDGTRIPDYQWGRWIPEDWDVAKTDSYSVNVPFGEVIGSSRVLPTKIELRVERDDDQLFTWDVEVHDPEEINTSAKAMGKLKESMSLDDRFKATHPFPIYERHGYWDFEAFVAGRKWTWDEIPDDAVSFHARGIRTEYTLIVPITDPATGNLIFNYYPPNPSATDIKHMLETDSRFFETV